MMCDCIWFSALFAGLPLFFHFPHVKVWYGWDLFWSVSSVRGRSAWPTAKYVFSHYSLPSRWPWSSTTCRILCEGLGRQRPCGPEKCWRDGLLPVMTKKQRVFHWWRKHPAALKLVEVPPHSIPNSRTVSGHYRIRTGGR